LEKLPPRLAVVEGGPIGCELTQAFCQFGSSVTLVGAAERIMLQDEPEAADVIAQRLVQDGVDLRTSAALQRVEKTATGVRLVLGDGGEVEAGAVLVSVGRRPQVEGLELEQAKVNHGPGGTQVNKKLRTSQPNIFAAGDCTGGYQFTHYAGYQGFTAGRDAFHSERNRYYITPAKVKQAIATVQEKVRISIMKMMTKHRKNAPPPKVLTAIVLQSG